MQESLFIVWRESIEALLIIGILYAWLRRKGLTSQVKRLWIGVGLGIFLSGLLAVVFWIAGQLFSGAIGECFFTFMIMFSSFLILQTVSWIHRFGNMKEQLELKTARSMACSANSGIMILSMLSIAREGVETIIFLTGIGIQRQGSSFAFFILGSILGFCLAVFTFVLLKKFSYIIAWKYFFHISTFVLLLIGSAMMVNAVDKVANQLAVYDLPEWIYAFIDNPLWSTEWLIPNTLFTSLLGYRSDPSLMQVCILVFYWAAATILCSGESRKR